MLCVCCRPGLYNSFLIQSTGVILCARNICTYVHALTWQVPVRNRAAPEQWVSPLTLVGRAPFQSQELLWSALGRSPLGLAAWHSWSLMQDSILCTCRHALSCCLLSQCLIVERNIAAVFEYYSLQDSQLLRAQKHKCTHERFAEAGGSLYFSSVCSFFKKKKIFSSSTLSRMWVSGWMKKKKIK